MTTIPVCCDPSLKRVPFDSLHRFQGNLKTLSKPEYEKLRDSLVEHGFFVPVFQWQGNILDGHQRLFVIQNEGWELDGDVPVVDIIAADKNEAAAKVLLLSSTYGKVQPEGVYEFAEKYGLDVGKADLPDFNFEAWRAEFYDGDGGLLPDAPEQEEPKLRGEVVIEIACTRSAFDYDLKTVLNEWSQRDDITVDIS